MKKIFFCLSFLLGLLLPTYAHTQEAILSDQFEIVQQPHLFIADAIQHQNLYFFAYLLEENNDDVKNSEKEKFSSGKNAFTITPFIPVNFSDNSSGKKSLPDVVLNYALPDFIYFRILRL